MARKPRAMPEEADKRGPGRPPAMVKCAVFVPNLWTSRGKFYLRDTVELPKSEAEWLDGRKQVMILGD